MSGTVSFQNGPDRLPLEDGTALHLLPAMAVLEARAEAHALAAETGGDPALCANACLLANAWRRRGVPLCPDGQTVLKRLSVSQIQSLARRWAAFDREVNPGFSVEDERLDALKKARTCRRSACAGMCCGPRKRFRRSRVSGT